MFFLPASFIEISSEMEDLLQGLKSCLRLSGKIGDSTMTGIIGAAMEDAYERILRSREGGQECLNQKSRFCGLAIMQLDWCLWILQEEMDDCCSDDDERLDLIGDLRVTRDRIRMRLDETEIAIADKEKKMIEMSEIVSDLLRELASKDVELRSLRSSLDLQGSDDSSSIGDPEPTGVVESNQVGFDLEPVGAEISSELSRWITDEEPTGFIPKSDVTVPSEDETFCSVKSKLETALQQMTMTRMQLREFGSDLGLPLDTDEQAEFTPTADIMGTKEKIENDIICPNVSPTSSSPNEDFMIQNRKKSESVAIEAREDELGEIQSVADCFKSFSQRILDLEETASIKTRENTARLQALNSRMHLLVKQASSRRTESIYQKAFIRRCYNLQTAEIEVDLLGDEVDKLMNLLEKVYLVLDYYSPVLQYYQGIMGVLTMLKKELFGGVSAGLHCK